MQYAEKNRRRCVTINNHVKEGTVQTDRLYFFRWDHGHFGSHFCRRGSACFCALLCDADMSFVENPFDADISTFIVTKFRKVCTFIVKCIRHSHVLESLGHVLIEISFKLWNRRLYGCQF